MFMINWRVLIGEPKMQGHDEHKEGTTVTMWSAKIRRAFVVRGGHCDLHYSLTLGTNAFFKIQTGIRIK